MKFEKSESLERNLANYLVTDSCPEDCGPVIRLKGSDLFPFRWEHSPGFFSSIRIGYICPHCGYIASYSGLPKVLENYLIRSRPAIIKKHSFHR